MFRPHLVGGQATRPCVGREDPRREPLAEGDMTPGTPILDPLFSRNFGGLVLLRVEADFCDQGLIFQH